MADSLLREIELSHSWTPTLWWLGHAGFAIKYHAMTFYVDPCLSNGGERVTPAPLNAAEISNADMVLATHSHTRHMDPLTLNPLLAASSRAKVVMPKSAGEYANSIGISYDRMRTTDADLRIEYFREGDYIRVYAVPSAHPELNHTPLGGYPQLGYLIRCGGCTIYHAGDCVPYETLVERLRPYSVTVALLPIDGPENGNFTIEQAADLAERIEAQWIVPMHYGTFASSTAKPEQFVEHMLFHRPGQRFKVFECGEGWTVPED
ncbi:MAG: MBL fold metallo-hydrolase [Proteobacteria bacterium]|nr:MBL fold metallo-hydrolase [Pseudomonadota bacterium]